MTIRPPIRVIYVALLCFVGACSPLVDTAASLQAARETVYATLVGERVLTNDASITHLTHVCSLRVEGMLYPVIDLQETSQRGLTAGGANTIVVLSPALKVVHKLPYVSEAPLYCEDDTLFVFGDLDLGDLFGIGNRLKFRDRAETILADSIDVTKMPMQPSGGRKSAPQ